MVLLAIILQDEGLYNSAQMILNLSVNERKMFKSILFGGGLTKLSMTTNLEEMILKVISHLIVLQEFEIFESISLVLITSESDRIKQKLGEVLTSYGFHEVAIDILVKCFEKKPNSSSLVSLLGDICLKSGYLQDAQLLYNKLLEIKPDYSSYERCYDLYEVSENVQGMRVIKEEIKRKFPLATWVKGFQWYKASIKIRWR